MGGLPPELGGGPSIFLRPTRPVGLATGAVDERGGGGFVVLAGGRSYFRVEDLIELVRLVEGLRS